MFSTCQPAAVFGSSLLSFGFHTQTDFLGYLCSFARRISHQKQIQMNTPLHIVGFLFNTDETQQANLRDGCL